MAVSRPESLRRKLLALAAELLSSEGEPVAAVEVVVRTPDGSTEHTVRSNPGELDPRPPPGLSPIETRIFNTLTAEWQSAKSIARQAGRAAGYVRSALRALCDRQLAEYRPRAGYRRVV